MTKVEEVARAIYEKNPLYGHRPNLGEGVHLLPWDSIPEHQGDYRDQARAAIKAMREPTEAMLNMGPDSPYMDRDVWASMIDAALSEDKG